MKKPAALLLAALLLLSLAACGAPAENAGTRADQRPKSELRPVFRRRKGVGSGDEPRRDRKNDPVVRPAVRDGIHPSEGGQTPRQSSLTRVAVWHKNAWFHAFISSCQYMNRGAKGASRPIPIEKRQKRGSTEALPLANLSLRKRGIHHFSGQGADSFCISGRMMRGVSTRFIR